MGTVSVGDDFDAEVMDSAHAFSIDQWAGPRADRVTPRPAFTRRLSAGQRRARVALLAATLLLAGLVLLACVHGLPHALGALLGGLAGPPR